MENDGLKVLKEALPGKKIRFSIHVIILLTNVAVRKYRMTIYL